MMTSNNYRIGGIAPGVFPVNLSPMMFARVTDDMHTYTAVHPLVCHILTIEVLSCRFHGVRKAGIRHTKLNN